MLDNGCVSMKGLTKTQEVYLVGRNKKENLGDVPCHVYMEFDGAGISLEKLQNAWSKVFIKHPVMNTKISSDGTLEIMDKAFSERILYFDFSEKSSDYIFDELKKIRGSFSHRKMRIEYGQTVGLILVKLPQNKNKLIFDLDLLMCDVYGFQVILNDLAAEYGNDLITAETPESEIISYPKFPFKNNPKTLYGCEYTSLTYEVDSDVYKEFEKKSLNCGFGKREILLALFGKAISETVSEDCFSINVPVFNIEKRMGVVGDYTDLIFIRQYWKKNAEMKNKFADVRAQLDGIQAGRLTNLKPNTESPAVVFSYIENQKLLSSVFEHTLGSLTYMISQTPEVALDCQIFETNKGLRIDWVYPVELFDENVLSVIFKRFIDLIIGGEW